MRTLALAQAWQRAGGIATLAAATLPEHLEARVARDGVSVVRIEARRGSAADAEITSDVAVGTAADWLALDGYHFDPHYQEVIRASKTPLLVLDDLGTDEALRADVLLNQNVHASEALYPRRTARTTLLLGARYALLRREFLDERAVESRCPTHATHHRHRVLVTLGGADAPNTTLAALRGVERLAPLRPEVMAVVGAAYPHLDALQQAAAASTVAVTIRRNATDMPALMRWAEVAVAAAGSTCWELCFMGVPSALIVLAANQAAIADALETVGAALRVGWHTDATPERIAAVLRRLLESADLRGAIAARGRDLVDGGGGERVVSALRRWLGEHGHTATS